jgi:ferrous iron transport protein B
MSKKHELTIAVVGNPNSGKTTLFNGLTGSKQKIGNWPGVTVEKKEGSFYYSADIHTGSLPKNIKALTQIQTLENESISTVRVVDLPGIYSLSANSEDEVVARDFVLSGEADFIVDVVDASNLQRNLFLTLQLIEMGTPVLVVLNMMDEAEKKGLHINVDHLSEHLGCPIIAASAINKDDISIIKDAISGIIHKVEPSSEQMTYPKALEKYIEEKSTKFEVFASLTKTNTRWVGLNLLEGDPWVTEKVIESSDFTLEQVQADRAQLQKEVGEELDVEIAEAKFAYINGLSKHVSQKKIDQKTLTERLDRVFLNRVAALPIFLGVMYAVFWVTMSFGGAFIDFFDGLFGSIFVDGFGYLLASTGSPEWLIGILAGGFGVGIQTVATFIPIIFCMFMMLSLLEDSGYMARAAFVMDRFMRAIGLPGKSFVPMMVGFGCTVPAIMGTRTLDSKRDRFTTIFMAPNMSCGARLPVYALFGAAFFGASSGLVVFGLYMIGIMVAILVGFLVKTTLFQGKPSHFIMELPSYHMPRFKFVMAQAWERLRMFIGKAGAAIILIVTILSLLNTIGIDGSFGNEDSEDSVLSAIGKTITPVFTPMGIEEDNWPATVGLFTGLFAKEAVVGTLNSLYAQEAKAEVNKEADSVADTADSSGVSGKAEGFDLGAGIVAAFETIPVNLLGAVEGAGDPFGVGVISDDQTAVAQEVEANGTIFAVMASKFSSGGAFAYLLFILLYLPCLAAFGAALKELGPGLGAVLAVLSTGIAWAFSVLVYQFTAGLALGPVLAALGTLGGLALMLFVLGKTVYKPSRWEIAK